MKCLWVFRNHAKYNNDICFIHYENKYDVPSISMSPETVRALFGKCPQKGRRICFIVNIISLENRKRRNGTQQPQERHCDTIPIPKDLWGTVGDSIDVDGVKYPPTPNPIIW